MRLMDRVKDVQNASLEAQLRQKGLKKDAFVKSIEKAVLDGAAEGKSVVGVEYSIEPSLVNEFLKAEGFTHWELTETHIAIFLKPRSPPQKKEFERLFFTLF